MFKASEESLIQSWAFIKEDDKPSNSTLIILLVLRPPESIFYELSNT